MIDSDACFLSCHLLAAPPCPHSEPPQSLQNGVLVPILSYFNLSIQHRFIWNYSWELDIPLIYSPILDLHMIQMHITRPSFLKLSHTVYAVDGHLFNGVCCLDRHRTLFHNDLGGGGYRGNHAGGTLPVRQVCGFASSNASGLRGGVHAAQNQHDSALRMR